MQKGELTKNEHHLEKYGTRDHYDSIDYVDVDKLILLHERKTLTVLCIP